MSAKRIFLEIGSGADLHGRDYTKAAVRAVNDALHRNSLSLFRTSGFDRNEARVDVTIGAQHPERIDPRAVKELFPFGQVSVTVVQGGLDVLEDDRADSAVIANAAIAVFADLGR